MSIRAKSAGVDSYSSPWGRHSVRWEHIGYPLRPCPGDVQFVQSEVQRISRERAHVDVLLLGVTVELASLDWPANCSLTAIDSSRAMIDRLWRPPAGIESSAIEGLWNQLPLAPKSVDIVLGDGSLSSLPDACAIGAVLRQLAMVLDHGCYLVPRVFVRPEIPETPGRVIDALRSGGIGSFQVFKCRLLMALHGTGTEGVLLTKVYDTVCEAIPDRAALARTLGWSLESIDTIESYKDTIWRYCFPRPSQFRELAALDFLELNCHLPTYELGGQCPTFVLRRK
jgi:hypothetical protein